MEIYIGNIPKGTRPSEVRKLIKDSVRNRIFDKMFTRIRDLGRLDDGIGIEILTLESNKNRYGRLVVTSHRLGELTLTSLKQAKIRGQKLVVRPFVQRDAGNDRRKLDDRNRQCRRILERRKNRIH